MSGVVLAASANPPSAKRVARRRRRADDCRADNCRAASGDAGCGDAECGGKRRVIDGDAASPARERRGPPLDPVALRALPLRFVVHLLGVTGQAHGPARGQCQYLGVAVA